MSNLSLFEDDSASNVCDMSPCSVYRYRLSRHLGGSLPPLVFVMLNPSTADAIVPDPTWTRCLGFGRRFDRESVIAVNLFPFRTPYPETLRDAQKAGVDIIGPRGNQPLTDIAGTIVCAWGPPKWPFVRERARDVASLLTRSGHTLFCLGTAKDGSPRHPLMMPNNSILTPWAP
jgi:hypothetical protein